MIETENSSDIELQKLWQKQTISPLDLNDIRRRATLQTRKQRFYLALDIISLSPWLLFFIIDIELPPSQKVFLFVFMIMSLLTLLYIIKLRWTSLRSMNKNTGDYSLRLLQQLKNNQRLAYINKPISFIVILGSACMEPVSYLLGEITLAQAMYKGAISFAILAASLGPWVWWFHRREKRFEREAAELSRILKI
ncbi:hypothetical protein J3L16_03450 [Alteromonas sp. 5E99-2]|uniref:hypothetical protein n=1 Tax=Alteromonas sp. 5E99-2 TaxID=2817683 RepID=UPI001A97D707|nr:hypothetical protein [Alteromonas sp. 5E99-2]MBO1254741.1 hypothetical protein [Alteromonas sp. 5E99-2]